MVVGISWAPLREGANAFGIQCPACEKILDAMDTVATKVGRSVRERARRRFEEIDWFVGGHEDEGCWNRSIDVDIAKHVGHRRHQTTEEFDVDEGSPNPLNEDAAGFEL